MKDICLSVCLSFSLFFHPLCVCRELGLQTWIQRWKDVIEDGKVGGEHRREKVAKIDPF